MITSSGGDDVSDKSAITANDRYCKQEYAECNMSTTPIVVIRELPKNNAIVIVVYVL